jgi:hypothetical protein
MTNAKMNFYSDTIIKESSYLVEVTMEKPSSWLVIMYDVPSEPSKLKVRLWREFKRMGALYPQTSLCVLPDNTENRKVLQKIDSVIDKNGKIVKIRGKAFSEDDQTKILQMIRVERDKQYDEILEECQEFIEDINHNVDKKKTAQEEVEEMEEVLDGLRRWLARVKGIDWVEKPAAANRVAKMLVKCQDLMDRFTELSHPKKENEKDM